MSSSIQVKKLVAEAIIPTKAYEYDAGWDLYALEDGVLLISDRKLIGTGIAMSIPKGFYGRIADRSGNAYKFGVHVLAGIVDYGYSGEIKILLINLSHERFYFKKGYRIAQLIITPICTASLIEVNKLDFTDRGDSGFGSTGN